MTARSALRSSSAFFLLLALSAACAAGETPTYGAVNYVAPQSWSSSRSASSPPGAVTVTGVEAAVEIIDGVAVTDLLVRMRNPGPRLQEAVLLLSVPQGAAVRSFDFGGAASEPTATILPAGEAATTYHGIVAKLRDPALLEFVGSSLIRSSVFPVAAGAAQSVRVTYEHVLPFEGGRFEYVLPRTQRLADSTVPLRVAVRVRSASPIAAAYSPTHAIRARRMGPCELSVTVAEEAEREPGHFLLVLLPERGDLSATFFACPAGDGRGGAFMLLAGLPADAGRGRRRPQKRELTHVLDRSGSMAGTKIEQAKAALLQVIQSMREGESFNVILYDSVVQRFAPAPLVKSPETEQRARAYLAAADAGGGTNLHDALLEALKPAPAPGALPIVLLLSDGLPTVGVTSESAIRRAAAESNVHRRRIFAFGVGHDVNVPLLDAVAESSRGCMTSVLPNEDVEEKVSLLFDRLDGPVLTDPAVAVLGEGGEEAPGAVMDLEPAQLPDLFRGGRLVLFGRYTGPEPMRLKLTGTFLGEPKSFVFPFDPAKASPRNVFVNRLWASRRIARLIDGLRQEGAGHRPSRRSSSRAPAAEASMDAATRERVDEIVRLSLKYGILTEYTAFLALEGTDLADAASLARDTNSNIESWAVRGRSGAHATSQNANFSGQRRQEVLNGRNGYIDRNNDRVESGGVQQVSDLAFFRRGARWVDARVAARRPGLEPDETVVFGSERFAALLAELAAANRQGALSLGGEVWLDIGGRTVRVVFGAPEGGK